MNWPFYLQNTNLEIQVKKTTIKVQSPFNKTDKVLLNDSDYSLLNLDQPKNTTLDVRADTHKERETDIYEIQ